MTACVSSAEVLVQKGWMAGLQCKPQEGFFPTFLQETYIRASKHKERDGMRCTSWSEVGMETAPAKLCNKSAVFPVSRQQHLWNRIVAFRLLFHYPTWSNPLGRFSSFGYYDDAYHIIIGLKQAPSQSFLQRKRQRQEKIMMPTGQEASVLDLALPPTSYITKKNHITSRGAWVA